MAKTIFEKELENEDVYDQTTTLSAELGDLVKDLPAENKTDIAKTILKKEYGQGYFKIGGGFVLIIAGIFMIILGINDVINFEFTSTVLSGKLINASPGVFICLLGFLIIIKTKSKVKK